MSDEKLPRAPRGYRKCTDKTYRGRALDAWGDPITVTGHGDACDGSGRHAFWAIPAERPNDMGTVGNYVYVAK